MIELIHQFSVFAMTGIIWIIQLVHYPSFHFVEKSSWSEFHHFHTFWITPVVAPLMLIQLGSSLFLEDPFKWIFLGLSFFVFAVTFFVSVPLHNRLEKSYDEKTVQKLIQTNWVRTLIWSVHALLLLFK